MQSFNKSKTQHLGFQGLEVPWQQFHFARFPSSVKYQCGGWHCSKNSLSELWCVCLDVGISPQQQLHSLESRRKDSTWIPEFSKAGIWGFGLRQPVLESPEAVGDEVLHQACWRGNFLPHGTALVPIKSSSLRSQAVRRVESSSLPFLLPSSSSCWYSKLPNKLSELPCYSNESTFLLWLASVYGMGSVFHN